MTIDLTPPEFRILVGGTDVTPFVKLFKVQRSELTSPPSPLIWTGSLELAPFEGVVPPYSFDPRPATYGDDPNPSWAYGQTVEVQVYRPSTGQIETAWKLRVRHASPPTRSSSTLKLDLVDLSGLLDAPVPPADVPGLALGVDFTRALAWKLALQAGYYPTDKISLPATADTINFNLADLDGNLIQFAQSLIAAESLWQYVQAEDEVITAQAWTLPASALYSLDPDECAEYQEEEFSDVRPSKIVCTGTRVQFQGYSNPGTNCSYVYLPYSQITGLQYPAGTGAAQYTQSTATSEETCSTTTGDGVTSLTVDTLHKIPRVTAESQGFTSNPPPGAVIRNISIQLEMIADTGSKSETTYDSNRRVTSITQDVLNCWWKLGYHTGSGYSEAEQQTLGIFSREKVEYTYANSVDTTLSQVKTTTSVLNGAFNANTYPPPSNASGAPGSAGQYTVTQVINNNPVGISPGSAPTGSESQSILTAGSVIRVPASPELFRQRKIDVSYPSTTAQLTALAEHLDALLYGQLGSYSIALPWLESLVFGLAPFSRIDVGGRQFLINGPSFALTPTEATFGCLGLWIGGS